MVAKTLIDRQIGSDERRTRQGLSLRLDLSRVRTGVELAGITVRPAFRAQLRLWRSQWRSTASARRSKWSDALRVHVLDQEFAVDQVKAEPFVHVHDRVDRAPRIDEAEHLRLIVGSCGDDKG